MILKVIHCIRTDSNDPHFQKLATELEDDLRLRDGENHPFYSSLNRIGFLGQVILAFEDNLPAGSGAFRRYSPSTAEIKRMYTRPGKRGLGIASLVLRNLEEWAPRTELFRLCAGNGTESAGGRFFLLEERLFAYPQVR